MPQNVPKKKQLILILFMLFIIMVGIILALFWSMGGFFLMMSILSILTHVPSLNIKMRKVFLGIDEAKTRELYSSHPRRVVLSIILGTIIILTWIGLTIIAFAKMNTPLIEILYDFLK